MRGADETSGSLFSYVDLEERIPPRHPLRKIRQVVNDRIIDAALKGCEWRGHLKGWPLSGLGAGDAGELDLEAGDAVAGSLECDGSADRDVARCRSS